MFILAGGMMGQFQGILGNLQKGKKLPMGRGYAPPGAGGITYSISTVYFVLYINCLYILKIHFYSLDTYFCGFK